MPNNICNICRNCKWAEWHMTKHQPPRVNPRLPGKCAYPVTRVALPVAMLRGLHFFNGIHDGMKSAVWWTDEHPCRVWEKKGHP